GPRGRPGAGSVRRGPRAGAEDPAGAGRGRRPVLPRRPGDPRPDRGPGLRRADRPAGPDPLDQGPAAGTRRRGADDGPAARQALRPGEDRRLARRDRARVAAIGEHPVKAGGDRALRDSYRFCGALSRREARNFYYAFLLLPPGRRRSMCALYAFLRHTDDLADEPGPAEPKAEALESWRRALDAALAGDPAAWPGLPARAD